MGIEALFFVGLGLPIFGIALLRVALKKNDWHAVVPFVIAGAASLVFVVIHTRAPGEVGLLYKPILFLGIFAALYLSLVALIFAFTSAARFFQSK
jgi:hypothetical protein